MATKFKAGAIVRLKSGGPVMTVEGPHFQSGVWASWFAGSKHNKVRFEDQALEEVRDEDLKKK